MTLEDVTFVMTLEAVYTPSPWSAAMLQDEIQQGSYGRILEDALGQRRGYCIARLLWDEWHLLLLGIEPTFRRQGGAKHLVNMLIQHASTTGSRAVLLEVRASNEPAKMLYQDIGFNFLYTRRGYYPKRSGTEDAMVLDYRLAGSLDQPSLKK